MSDPPPDELEIDPTAISDGGGGDVNAGAGGIPSSAGWAVTPGTGGSSGGDYYEPPQHHHQQHQHASDDPTHGVSGGSDDALMSAGRSARRSMFPLPPVPLQPPASAAVAAAAGYRYVQRDTDTGPPRSGDDRIDLNAASNSGGDGDSGGSFRHSRSGGNSAVATASATALALDNGFSPPHSARSSGRQAADATELVTIESARRPQHPHSFGAADADANGDDKQPASDDTGHDRQTDDETGAGGAASSSGGLQRFGELISMRHSRSDDGTSDAINASGGDGGGRGGGEDMRLDDSAPVVRSDASDSIDVSQPDECCGRVRGSVKRHPRRCVGCGIILIFLVFVALAIELVTPPPATDDLWTQSELNATYTLVFETIIPPHERHPAGAAQYFQRMSDAAIPFSAYRTALQSALEAVIDNNRTLTFLSIAAILDPELEESDSEDGDSSGGGAATPILTTTPALGASKIGGEPHLPRAWSNPPAGAPPDARFIAQINLRDVIPYDLRCVLPARGMLYVYGAADRVRWQPPNQPNDRSVFYFGGETSELTFSATDKRACTRPACVELRSSAWRFARNCNLPFWTPDDPTAKCRSQLGDEFHTDTASTMAFDLLAAVNPSVETETALFHSPYRNITTSPVEAVTRLITLSGTKPAFDVAPKTWQLAAYTDWNDIITPHFERTFLYQANS